MCMCIRESEHKGERERERKSVCALVLGARIWEGEGG